MMEEDRFDHELGTAGLIYDRDQFEFESYWDAEEHHHRDMKEITSYKVRQPNAIAAKALYLISGVLLGLCLIPIFDRPDTCEQTLSAVMPGTTDVPTKEISAEMPESSSSSDKHAPVVETMAEIPKSRLQVSTALTVDLSAYSPKRNGHHVEGGYKSWTIGPDGTNQVRTLQDLVDGTSDYVTLAGKKELFGTKYLIPEITYIYTDKYGDIIHHRLRNVVAVVHDSGPAFSSAPNNQFSVPIGKDKSRQAMWRNHAAWQAEGVKFIKQ